MGAQGTTVFRSRQGTPPQRSGGRLTALALTVLLLALAANTWSAFARPDPFGTAWDRVRAAGAYAFAGEIEQVTTPTASVLHAGRVGRVERMAVEGSADLAAQSSEFRVWIDAQALGGPPSFAVKVEDGIAERRTRGGDWVRVADAGGVVGPSGDVLDHLAAARDVRDLGPHDADGTTVTRHAYTLHGPTYAEMVASQLTAAMRRTGGLAPGQRLPPSRQHVEMLGRGELWLDADGLPVRHLLWIEFPEADGEVVTAHLDVALSGFADPSPAGVLRVVLARSAPMVPAIVAMLVLLLAWRTRRRGVPHIGVAWALVGALVLSVSPSGAAHATTPVTPAPAPPTPDGPATEAALDPHRDRLATRMAGPALAGAGVDTDGDGLDDDVETSIGTSPDVADSDGDGLSDLVEVRGFLHGGQRWYPDPLAIDTNGDGLADGLELDADGDGTPDDTDAGAPGGGDGVPDLFDTDNDDDGVPDHLDLSPFAVGGVVHDATTPLALRVDGTTATPERPVFVDVQVRPVAAEQLRVAQEPFDWPADDLGQLRDVDDQPDDLTLVPMLQVRVPDQTHLLPLEADLDAYGIGVVRLDPAGPARDLFVPLHEVIDDATGEHVAFSGRIRYRSQSSWGPDHQVRMVWAVRMDNDVVCDPDVVDPADPAYVAGCGGDGYARNRPQIVHRYDTDWTLAGLRVVEEHGAEIAVVHEDPDLPGHDPDDDVAMWSLATVLSERLLTPTETTPAGDPEFALEVGDLEQVLDHTMTPATPAPHGLDDVYRVDHAQYASLDEAVARTEDTVVPAVQTGFDDNWTGPDALRPLLLTAWTSRTRETVLEDTAGAGAAGASVALDLAGVPASTVGGMRWRHWCGGDDASAPRWEPCATGEVWDELLARHDGVQLDPADLTSTTTGLDTETADGQTIITQLHALALATGVSTQLRRTDANGRDVALDLGYQALDDGPLASQVVAAQIAPAKVGPKILANRHFFRNLAATDDLVRDLGRLKVTPTKIWPGLKAKVAGLGTGGRTLVGLAAAATASGFIAAAVLAGQGDEQAADALKVIATSGSVLTGTLMPMATFARVGVVLRAGGKSYLSILGTRSQYFGSTHKAAMVGAGIAIGLAWGSFIHGVVSSGVEAFSPTFNQALAGTIAVTLFTLLSLKLAATGVGLVVLALVAGIDAILALVCELEDDDSCFTISGSVIQAITDFLYSYDVMVATSGLFRAGAPVIGLRDPDLGYVVGNAVDVALPVTSTVVHKDPSAADWHIVAFLYFFSQSNLRSATVEHSLTSPSKQTLATARDRMTADWGAHVDLQTGAAFAQPADGRVFQSGVLAEDHTFLAKTMYGATTGPEVFDVVGGLPFAAAGLNRSYDVHLNSAYALPAFECWTGFIPILPPIPFPLCYTRTHDGATSNSFDPLYFDVLPATIDAFLARTGAPGARRLAWDPAFPTLADADHDDLDRAGLGGLDPDDEKWDTDGDGLGDAIELVRGQAGSGLSARQWDTDGDGLSDAQELRLGTDPAVRDTDNDGLTDAEEVRHLALSSDGTAVTWTGRLEGGWAVPIAGAPGGSVHVSSDPRSADGDEDGVSDAAERQLAGTLDEAGRPFHPNVVNISPISLALATDAGTFVAPGDVVTLTTDAIATSPMAPSVLDLNLPTQLGGPQTPALLAFDPATFVERQVVTRQDALTVSASATGNLTITADARARLEDRAAPSPPQWLMQVQAETAGSAERGHADVAASRGDRGDAYVLADVSSSQAGAGGAGDVRVRDLTGPATFDVLVDDDTDTSVDDPATPQVESRADLRWLRSGDKPSVACNAAGECLTVWEHVDNCRDLTVTRVEAVESGDGNDASFGRVEPAIVLRRTGVGDVSPGVDLLDEIWRAPSSLGRGQVAGPDDDGLPATASFCGDAELAVLELGVAATIATADVLQRSEPGPPFNVFPTTDLGDVLAVDQLSALDQTVSFTDDSYRRDSPFCTIFTCVWLDVDVELVDRPSRRVAGVTTGGDGSVGAPQFDVGAGGRPAVASDGTGFAVAWDTMDPTAREVRLVELDAAGVVRTTTAYPLTTTAPGAAFVDVTWIGDGYLVTVNDGGVLTAFDPNLPAGVTVGPGNGPGITTPGFAVAHDPVLDRILVVNVIGGAIVIGSLYDGSVDNGLHGNVLGISATGVVPVDAAYNPLTGGWLVTYDRNGELWAVNSDADLIVREGRPLAISGATGPSVACPDLSSRPDVDLRFEELPGATTFGDASLHGRDATATTPPSAGHPGAPAAALSDFAVRFGPSTRLQVPTPEARDGRSISFWYRALPGDGTSLFTMVAASAQPVLLTVDGSTGALRWQVGAERAIASTSALGDGSWHQVTVTHDPYAGELVAYVDAAEVARATGAHALTPVTGLEVVGSNAPTLVDHLRTWSVPLSGATVRTLFDRTDDAFCAAVASRQATQPGTTATHPWATMRFVEQDPRGGRVDAPTATLSLTVDADDPVATVAGRQGWLQGSTVAAVDVEVGGTASDVGSGIAAVEVQVDGPGTTGPWVPADGLDAWTFPVAVRHGRYEVRARARDAVGNVGPASAPAVLLVDGAAPVVTLDPLPSGPVVPTVDPGTGRSAVRLTGTVTDSGSYVVDGQVEVQLVAAGQPSTERGWQSATVVGGFGPWSLDYELPSSLAEVDGAFDVRVRATDQVGNRSATPPQPLGTLVVDGAGPTATLDASDAIREVLSGATSLGGVVEDGAGAGVVAVDVAFTPLQTVVTTGAPGTWLPATLGTTGAARTSWTIDVPAGLEGFVQVDLRATDALGNERLTSGAWRGIVDTAAPRVTVTATATGRVHSDASRREFTTTCVVEDLFLDTTTYDCDGRGADQAIPTVVADSSLQQVFPDQVLTSRLDGTHRDWERDTDPVINASACDLFGACATNATGPAAADLMARGAPAAGAAQQAGRDAIVRRAAAAPAAPSAVVVTPTAGEHVAVDGTVDVVVVAEAASVRRVTLLLDGTAVAERTWADGARSLVQEVLTVPVPTAGDHVLAVQVEGGDGQVVDSVPVTFFADLAAPTVAVTSTALDADASWGPGTDTYRLRGTVADAGTLTKVQARVDDGPWHEMAFDATSWRGAVRAPDADGRVLAVEVRATDLAGRRAIATASTAVDLAPAGLQRVDTTITTRPPASTASATASIAFVGVDGDDAVAAFRCRVDGGPEVPCASPWVVEGLTVGPHTATVTAVDGRGLRDLSPATASWTVTPRGPQPVFFEAPSDPSPSGDVRFVFHAPGAATYACALDDAAWAPCASPLVHTDLARGRHVLRVRATVSGVTGTPVAHRWSVGNEPPVARDQVLVVGQDDRDGHPVTLPADDVDPLVFRIVEPPRHGFLEGTGEQRRYVPFAGYTGPDRFTWQADDQQDRSNVATVHVTVRMGELVVLGDEGVALRKDVVVERGSVGVNRGDGTPVHGKYEVFLGSGTRMLDPGSRVVADGIDLKKKAVVRDAWFNEIKRKGQVLGTSRQGLAVPWHPLPALPSVTVGGEDVLVDEDATLRLAPGVHGDLVVDKDATIWLEPGLHHFGDVTLDDRARLLVLGPTELRLDGRLTVDKEAVVGPAADGQVDDLVVHVAAANGKKGRVGDKPLAVDVGKEVVLTAYVVAPNGTVLLEDRTLVTGAIAGRWVDVDKGVRLAAVAN